MLNVLTPTIARSLRNPSLGGLIQHKTKSPAYKSVGTSDAKPRIFKRGGRRNRKGRITLTLSAKQCASIVNAIFDTRDIGQPFNRFITIHWDRAGCRPDQGASASQAFVTFVRHWLNARGYPCTYVWVRENDDGDGSKGEHVHILLHLPKGVSLARLQQRWIKAITHQPYRRGVINTRVIAGYSQAATAAPEHYWANVCAVGEYVLKGGLRCDLNAIGLTGRWGDGGRVVGQRVGMSRNLSRIARGRIIG
jgi:hypothetical protein